jgi:hypothetical protein
MKNPAWTDALPGIVRPRPSRRDGASALSQKLLRTLKGLHAAWPRSAARSCRRESVRHLDHGVLEEIGLTREQVRHDATQPVWWR